MQSTRRILLTLPIMLITIGFAGLILLAGFGIMALINTQAKNDQLCNFVANAGGALEILPECQNSDRNWILLQLAPYFLIVESVFILFILLTGKIQFWRDFKFKKQGGAP